MNHPYTAIDKVMGFTDCYQCGFQYEFHLRYLHREGAWWLCKSCKAQPQAKISYGNDYCLPWQGDFDDDLLICLDERGKPYKVGKRTCDHADCVRTAHLVVEELSLA